MQSGFLRAKPLICVRAAETPDFRCISCKKMGYAGQEDIERHGLHFCKVEVVENYVPVMEIMI